MYKDGQKALLMMKDSDLRNLVERYLYNRYNLQTDFVDGIIEVLQQVDVDFPYWLVILDESVEGLAATSHALKKIKEECVQTNVLFLSNFLEIFEPYNQMDMPLAPEYTDRYFRMEQSEIFAKKRNSLQYEVKDNYSLNDLCNKMCKKIVREFQVDSAFVAILKFQEKPPTGGRVLMGYPQPGISNDFELKGTGHLQQLVNYFKPIHIPDLSKEKAFQMELEEKFSGPYGSALLLPMQRIGINIGFIGLFTREKERLYSLMDLDLCQRLADSTTVLISVIATILNKNVTIRLVESEE